MMMNQIPVFPVLNLSFIYHQMRNPLSPILTPPPFFLAPILFNPDTTRQLISGLSNTNALANTGRSTIRDKLSDQGGGGEVDETSCFQPAHTPPYHLEIQGTKKLTIPSSPSFHATERRRRNRCDSFHKN